MKVKLMTPYGIRYVSTTVLESLISHADNAALVASLSVRNSRTLVEISRSTSRAFVRLVKHIQHKCHAGETAE